MCEPCAPDALLEAVRGLRVTEPDLGLKPLLTKLREQRPELGAATKEVREALATLKAESEAAAKASAPAAAERRAPSNVTLSLACIGCARLPSEMPDGREKHPICDKCKELKLPTVYMCGMNCPANPGAWELHGVFHKKLRKQMKRQEDGGVRQQRTRETAEQGARLAAQTGSKYDEAVAEGLRSMAKEDWRKAGKAFREAIALQPDQPGAYYNLGFVLDNSGHKVEAAQRYLEASERYAMGSEHWAVATAAAFDKLRLPECDVRRGGQAGVVERRGAQGAVGEGGAGGAKHFADQSDAGCGAKRERGCLGGGALLSSGAQGGSCALRSGCGAVPCSGVAGRIRRACASVPQPGIPGSLLVASAERHVLNTLPASHSLPARAVPASLRTVGHR